MHSVAKSTIIIPVVILLIAAVMRFSQATYKLNTKGEIRPSVSAISSSPDVLDQSNNVSQDDMQALFPSQRSGKGFNLKGPYACSVTDAQKDMKLFIKDRSIYIRYKELDKINYILIKGDCAYKWSDQDKQGIKVCDIGQYLSLVDSLSKIPFFSTDILFSMISELKNSSTTEVKTEDIKKLVNSCEETDIDNDLFVVPVNVTFIEQEINGKPEDLLNAQ